MQHGGSFDTVYVNLSFITAALITIQNITIYITLIVTM